MDWQKSGYQTFRIMWSTKRNDDCQPPLQVRSFTSDSYRAIKERERKRCQQKKAAFKPWSTRSYSESQRESASLDAAVAAQWSGAELEEDIYMTDSTTLQLVAQEGYRVQSDGGTQQNIIQPSVPPTGLVENDCEGTTRYLDASTSGASSPIVLGSTSQEPITDTELGSDSSQAMALEQSAVSTYEVDMIVPNDIDTPVEEPGSALHDETALTSPTQSSSAPTHGCVAGSNTELYEQPMPDDDDASLRLVFPRPNTVHVIAAAMVPSRNELGLTTGLLDPHGHDEPRRYQAGFNQAGRISKGSDLVPQALWTKHLDEYLLHLRNVAQLEWEDIVNYFPTMTPSAVQCRHQHLCEANETASDVDDRRSTRFQERSAATSLATPTSSKCEHKIAKLHRATSRLPVASKLARTCRSLRQPCKFRQANNGRIATAPVLSPRESPPQRSSRCGRPIRHPFRNRPKEGYL